MTVRPCYAMDAKLSDWLKLTAIVFVVIAFAGIIALMMNLTGDCAPGVEHCGETARQLSFGVLALGALGSLLLIVRFIHAHRR